ncbi:hypothetical protein IAG44_15170 [Streptomyces roseirectus]|uniref:Uncharacterized protein n=1 Tax=Streptomyces roseirectus TaxID=2768066 RepID=A0A7H0ITW2_9ACTN|nr:hypothetical protein IAG44_15170 [Streptomyces roseirectus]
MKLTRPLSWFLLAFGVWSWVIRVTFHNTPATCRKITLKEQVRPHVHLLGLGPTG